jgi:hypothetical protein
MFGITSSFCDNNPTAEWLLSRQQGDKFNGTMNMVSAAYKVMQHQQKFEDEDPAAADGNAQAEALRLMLDAMWAANALDIQTIVSKVCQTVRVLHFVPVPCTVLNCLEAIKA